MDYDEILRKILRKYGAQTDNIRQMQIIESKLKKHTANYADAEHYAQDIGRILTDVLREYLPEALTDGKLYRAAAEVLVQQPMITAGKDVADVSKRIQQAMNEDAGIGMNAIDPGLNQDQIDGIITGICNAESYDGYVERFMDQVAGFFEGEVDDFVRENADFQYKAGLSPTIERKISGKCCSWCAKLAGTYPYEDVRDRGNDVFRRHNNCHCLILYNPADGSKRRQDVHLREWGTEEELRERRLRFGQKESFERDNGSIKATPVKNYRANHLYIDESVNLSPREVRRINTQITKAKELHGIVGSCDAPFVIVNDKKKLAAYNPRTNVFFISSRMANEKDILKLQQDYVCPRDSRSTMVHEIFHWKDAEDYKKAVGVITDASKRSEYTLYQQDKALEGLKKAGLAGDVSRTRSIVSEYAAEKMLDNDYEEAYTELRTKELIEGGGKR